MICPECGYDMGNRSKCYRCGYEVKTLTVVDSANDEEDTEKANEEKIETKVIDPCNVYITHPYGVEDDVFGDDGGAFTSLFDRLFGDPISDLLGGLFGINLNPRRSVFMEDPPPPPKKKKKGPIIVVDDIEIIPADEAKKNMEEAQRKMENAQKQEKHRFKKGNKNK